MFTHTHISGPPNSEERSGTCSVSLTQWQHTEDITAQRKKPPWFWLIWVSLVFTQPAMVWAKAVYPRNLLSCIESNTSSVDTTMRNNALFEDKEKTDGLQTRGLLGSKTAPEQLQQENTVKIEFSNSGCNRYSCSLHHSLPKMRNLCATLSLGERQRVWWLLLILEVFLTTGKGDARRKCGLLHGVFQVIWNWWVSCCWMLSRNYLTVQGESGKQQQHQRQKHLN